jgi:putative ABC transport system permease protein
MDSMRLKWFMRFLTRAIMERRSRVAVAVLSVMIAVGIIVSALGISLGIRTKLGGELKAYGANVMVSKPGGFLDDNDTLGFALAPEKGVEHFALQLYSGVEVSHPGGPEEAVRLELIGMELRKATTLRVIGTMPAGPDEMLAGANVRDAFGLKLGQALRADFDGNVHAMRVSGFVETGGPEDGSLIVEIERARELTGLMGKVSAVLVRADTTRLEETVENLSRALDGAEVKTLSQVARAEQSFLAKIEMLMALVAFTVLVASSISVSSTMSATVLERLKEIGLMKAIGGTRREIGAFFMAEGLAIGCIGGILGYGLGFLAAQAVSKGAFGSFIPVPLYLLLGGVVAGAALSVAASLWPLLGALRYRPSIILRGE